MLKLQPNHLPHGEQISPAKAALIAGLGLLVMLVTVPIAEFYIFPELIVSSPAQTADNLLNNKTLFMLSVFLHLITIICDIVVAWALYILLKPVSKQLSLVTAWFRLIYTAMYLVALANLVKVINLINIQQSSNGLNTAAFSDSTWLSINSFQLEWEFGLLIFGIYLLLLGYLVFKASYIPRVFGMLLVLAGLGYLVYTASGFFWPEVNLDFLFLTFFGESIFMFWLLIKGARLKSSKD